MISAEKKAEKVAFAKHHREADMLVSGHYIEKNGKFHGCSVGCDAISIALANKQDPLEIRTGFHAYVAGYFGTPEWLEHLRDSIFEGLPQAERLQWHTDLAEALPVGVDFKPIRHAIQRDILREVALPACGEGDEKWRVDCRAAVEAIAALHERSITDKDYSDAFYSYEAARAAGAARAAEAAGAAGAAWAAGAARAAEAAEAAWAAWAAWAAGAAGAAWAARAARAASWKKIAAITLRNLREATTATGSTD